MIFVTVGTTHFQFDRLIEGVGRLPTGGEELVVQRGASRVAIPNATVFDFLRYEEVYELARRARILISHSGVGSIMTALAAGRRPIVVPRLERYGEAVDDHQVEVAFSLAAQARVVVATIEELPALVASHVEPHVDASVTRGPLLDVVADEARRALRV